MFFKGLFLRKNLQAINIYDFLCSSVLSYYDALVADLVECSPCVCQVMGSNPGPGDTNHPKSGTYCFLAKNSAIKGQSLEQFASWYKLYWGSHPQAALKHGSTSAS